MKHIAIRISKGDMFKQIICENNENNKVSLGNSTLDYKHKFKSLRTYTDLVNNNEREEYKKRFFTKALVRITPSARVNDILALSLTALKDSSCNAFRFLYMK